MSWYDRVIWSEGLFLRPQHFQQQDRRIEDLLEARASSMLGYRWGFRSLEINGNALALGKIELASARGVMSDGTPFDFPGQDPPPEALEIGSATKDEPILLALPLRRQGMPEIADADPTRSVLTRFSVGEMELADTHTGSSESAPVQVGRLRLRLLRQSDITDAYATIGVAHVVERRADNQLVLDNGYIPPMLGTVGNGVLQGYVRELVGLLSQRGAALASRMTHPGRGGVAEIADFLFLQTVNRYEPLFRHFASHSLLHPERLFSVCLQLAGDLGTFSKSPPRALTPPQYEHDALAKCFGPVMADLRLSLSMVLEQAAIPIELLDRKYGVYVAVIPDKSLFKTASLVLAVNAQLPPDAIRQRFPNQVKIGPAERIRDLVNVQLPGIPLRPLPIAPRQIPFHAGFNYFQLEPGGELWNELTRSGGIAMHVPGDFPGLELEFWAIRNQ